MMPRWAAVALLSACTAAGDKVDPTDTAPELPPHRWIFIGSGAADVSNVELDNYGWTPVGDGWPDVQLFADAASARAYLYPRILTFFPVNTRQSGRSVDDVLSRFDARSERLVVVWRPDLSTKGFPYLTGMTVDAELGSFAAELVYIAPAELWSTEIVPQVAILALPGTHWSSVSVDDSGFEDLCEGSAPADCDLPDDDFYSGEDPFPSDFGR
jgi:hypothetical protein